MKKSLVALIITLATLSAAAQQQRMTLDDLIGRLVRVNYTLLQSENRLQIAKNNVTAAPFLPTLSATAVQRQTLGATSTNALSVGAQLSWRMFDGGAMFYQYSRSKEVLGQAELQFYAQLEQLTADLIAQYNYIISLKNRVELGERTVNLSKERYNEALSKYELKSASGLEMRLAKTDLNADSSSLITMREALDVAYIQMAGMLNMDYATRGYVNDSIVMDAMPGFSELMGQTTLSNTQILLSRRGARISELDTKTARAARYPTLDFGASATGGLNAAVPASSWNDASGGSWGFSIGANIFNGSEVTRRIKNAKLEQQNAELEVKSVENQVLTAFNEQYLRYRNNLQLIDFESENAAAMALNLEVAMMRYKLGDLSGIDFRNIQLQYLTAQERRISTLYQAKLSQIELMLLCGALL